MCHPFIVTNTALTLLQKISTNTYVYNADLRKEVEDCAVSLSHTRSAEGPERDYELVIDVASDPKRSPRLSWFYYYVDHDTHSVVWLEDNVFKRELDNVHGVVSPDHICMLPLAFYP